MLPSGSSAVTPRSSLLKSERRYGHCSTPANSTFISYKPCHPVFDRVIENTVHDESVSVDVVRFPAPERMTTFGIRKEDKKVKIIASAADSGPGGPRLRVPTPIPCRNSNAAYAGRAGKLFVQELNGGYLRMDEEGPQLEEVVFGSPIDVAVVCVSKPKKGELLKRILVKAVGKVSRVFWRARS